MRTVFAGGPRDLGATKKFPWSNKRRHTSQCVFLSARHRPEQLRRPESHASLDCWKEPGGRGPFSHHGPASAFNIVAVRPSRLWKTMPWSLILKSQGAHISREFSQWTVLERGLSACHRLAPTPSPRARTVRDATSNAHLTTIPRIVAFLGTRRTRVRVFPPEFGMRSWTRRVDLHR